MFQVICTVTNDKVDKSKWKKYFNKDKIVFKMKLLSLVMYIFYSQRFTYLAYTTTFQF